MITETGLNLSASRLGQRSRALSIGRWLRHNVVAVIALTTLLGIVGIAIVAPWLAPQPPLRQNILKRHLPPAWEPRGDWTYPLGSDALGRDVLSRIMHGARVSLAIGFAAVAIACLIGSLAGLLAGYFGGHVDAVIMRLADTFFAIPFILLAMAVVAVFGQDMINLIVTLGVARWAAYARIQRASVLAVRARDFIESARAVGASPGRVIFRHIWPNASGSLIVIATLEIANMIIYESALGFLGLGVKPPQPTWGNMLADGRDAIMVAWWVTTFPGLAILTTVFCINLLGDWLRDWFDPRLRLQL